MNKTLSFILIITLLNISISDANAQIMEIKGGRDSKSISTRMHSGIPSSRVIIQSNLSLEYNTNMGEIAKENIGSGIVNGLNVDTLYFYLDSKDNHRRLVISSHGYAPERIDLELLPKFTYRYVINAYASKNISLVANRKYISRYGEYFVEFFAKSTPNPNSYNFSIDNDAEIGFISA